MLEEDEDAAAKSLFNSKYVFLHDGLGTTAWASTKAGDEFSQDFVNGIDTILNTLDTAGVKTYIYFNYIWVQDTLNNFEQKINEMFSKSKNHIQQHTGVSDFNLLVVVNAKYNEALSGGLRSASFREKFYPMNGLDAACTKAVKDYLNDETKKKFSDGLNEALKERAEKLLEKLKGCKVEKPKEIVILYKRKGHNKYRTWGEFTIVGTDYKGYILERPKGSEPTRKQDFMRHPAGEFNLLYSDQTTGTKEKFWGVTMCLAGDTGYKLHGGNRADNSDGCFLINYKSPQNDRYPEAYDAMYKDINLESEDRRDNPDRDKYPLANEYYSHKSDQNPAKVLRNYVYNLEEEIKKKLKTTFVIKKFIIDESEELKEND